MPRNSRRNSLGQFHHIMSQGINKEYIFNNENLKQKYKKIINDKSKQNNVKIYGYCIMDNHVHLLIYVEIIEDMCKFMQQVNTTYAKMYNRMYNRVGYVFRNRYLSKPILDEEQLKRCIVYIHKNPVVAKMVKKEREYKFSSYNEYLSNMEDEIISLDSKKIIFGNIKEKLFKEIYDNIHNLEDNELKEFDNFEENLNINLEELSKKYSYLSKKERILKLNIEDNISERKLAEIFNKTRYQIRKILKEEI